MARKSRRHPEVEPAHPGDLLRDIVIPATGKTKTEIASLLGVSRQTLHDLLAKKQGVSADMALRLGKLFGNGADVWLRMQVAHDLWRAERSAREALSRIPTLKAA
jgi:addiction module HigA family antidote